MTTTGMLAAVLSLGFVGLMVLMQVAIRRRAAAMQGTKLPVLPGALGAQVSSAPDALVYFFSPTCGACQAITPRVRALQEQNPRVFAVDITQDLELARALNVMATPSTVEVHQGTIAGYHVGPIPEAVYARFK